MLTAGYLQSVNLEDLMKVLDRPLGENELWLLLLGTAKSLQSIAGAFNYHKCPLFASIHTCVGITNEALRSSFPTKRLTISGFPVLNPTTISIDNNGLVHTSAAIGLYDNH